jgi:nitroreductase
MIMTFSELIIHRQSVRKYDSKPVEPEKLQQCIEAARMAPSASNTQPWQFLCITSEPLRTQIAEATFSPAVKFNKFAMNAPVMVVILLEQPRLLNRIAMILKNKEWRLIDIGIAAEHFCLQATELGLGTCMLGWFNEKKIKQLLNTGTSKTVALCIALGYAQEDYKLRNKVRQPIEKMSSIR